MQCNSNAHDKSWELLGLVWIVSVLSDTTGALAACRTKVRVFILHKLEREHSAGIRLYCSDCHIHVEGRSESFDAELTARHLATTQPSRQCIA